MLDRFIPALRKNGREPARQRPADVFEMMDDLMRSGFGGPAFGGLGYPALDVSDTAKEIIVKAELPGMDKENIDIHLDGNQLVVHGEKKTASEDKNERYVHVERSFGSFSRSVQLPAKVEPDGISATYKDGVLTIRLKKDKTAVPRRIAIEG